MNRTKSLACFTTTNTDLHSSDPTFQKNASSSQVSAQFQSIHHDDKNKLDSNQTLESDFVEYSNNDVNDRNKVEVIRRFPKPEDRILYYRRERFNFSQPIKRSVENDTLYYGSSFIVDWLVIFTRGTLKVKFSSIVKVLINGILIEGKKRGSIDDSQHLVHEIRGIKNKKIEKLQKCCARLYTKQCFLFQLVNETLRDNDRTKLDTLGPFCYLLYNYIGNRHNEYLSLTYQFKQLVHLKERVTSITVYRGEELSHDQIEVYKQAVGENVFFKWLSFVSTSKVRGVAEMFGSNVLYIIEIQGLSHNDQFVDLSPIAFNPEEQEILLRPGVRFRIKSSEYDPRSERHVFHIIIVPSFISIIA